MAFYAVEEQIEAEVYDCLILVHPIIEVIERTRDRILTHPNISEINIGNKLSQALLEISPSNRGRAAQRWLFDEVDVYSSRQLIFTQIDLLFEPGFGIDPLRLFLQVARKAHLIILWPGDFSNDTLSYAVPEHNHYRNWHISDPALFVLRLTN